MLLSLQCSGSTRSSPLSISHITAETENTVTCIFYVFAPWAPRRPGFDLRLVHGRAMAQAVSRRPLNAEARVRSLVSPCGICGGQSGTGTGLSPVNFIPPVLHYSEKLKKSSSCREVGVFRALWFSPVSTTPLMLRTHSFIHSFIHLPPTIYDLRNQQCPLARTLRRLAMYV